MNINIFSFTEQLLDLLTTWFSFTSKEWAWCPVKVNNRIDK